ncbi:MAG: RloB family protein [Candidatus Methylacidiphilales bacterium]
MPKLRNDRFNARKSGFREPKILHVIAMEGRETEYAYFAALGQRARENLTVKIELIYNHADKSSPGEVLNQIVSYRRRHGALQSDRYWVVIDHDGRSNAMLDEVCTNAAKIPHCMVALSNPCFELWLHFHLRVLPLPSFQDHHDCQNQLLTVFPGYTKTSYNVEKVLDAELFNLARAVDNAERTDIPGHTVEPWPRAQTSRLHLLARAVVNVPALPQQSAAMLRKEKERERAKKRADTAERKAQSEQSDIGTSTDNDFGEDSVA